MKTLDFDVADCLTRVRLGDQEAARSLVGFLAPLVRSIVRRRLPRGICEDDLLQEIFLKMFEKLDQYRGDVPLSHWVSRMAVNHCLNALRFQRARPEWRMADLTEEQQLALESKTTAGEASHPAQNMASRELVQKILQTLGPEDCLLIRMLDIEEFSIAEVRATTGWSAAYVRLRAFRARQKLNKRFARLKKEAFPPAPASG